MLENAVKPQKQLRIKKTPQKTNDIDAVFVGKIRRGNDRRRGDNRSIGWRITETNGKRRFMHASNVVCKALSFSANLDCDEKKLFFGVICQAVIDALNFGERLSLRHYRRDALFFFKTQSFRDICNLIDLNVDVVHEYISKVTHLFEQENNPT